MLFKSTLVAAALASAVLAVPFVARDKTASTFHPEGDRKKCMGVKGGQFVNGALVDIYDCNGSPTQEWAFDHGEGQISTIDDHGNVWCVDAGNVNELHNGVQLKIWQCYDVPQQNWSYDISTKSIHLSTGDYCLELPHGALTNQNVLIINTCVNTSRWDDSNSTRQQWTLPDFWWWPF